jgi:hypothetical protein
MCWDVGKTESVTSESTESGRRFRPMKLRVRALVCEVSPSSKCYTFISSS